MLVVSPVAAQQPIAYPARGQSQAVQSKDNSECRAWAQQSTGIDPNALAQQPVYQETAPATGGAVPKSISATQAGRTSGG